MSPPRHLLVVLASLAVFAGPTTAAPVRLLCFGDSITQGTASTARPPSWHGDGSSEGGYRANLYHALIASGVSADAFLFVGTQSGGPPDVPPAQRAHEGYPGWDINHLMSAIPGWAPLLPDALLLMAGTNSGNGVAECTGNMSLLLRMISAAAPQAELLVATIIADPGEPSYIDACNAALPAIVAQVPRARLVDMHNASKICSSNVGPACRDDGHPVQGGYPSMAAIWWRALQQAGFFPAESTATKAAALAAPLFAAAPPLSAPPSAPALLDATPPVGGRADGGPLRILALGDDLTLGCGSTARLNKEGGFAASCDASQGGFRSALYFALLGSGVANSSFLFVGSLFSGPDEVPAPQRAHEGRPGLTVAEITALADTWAASQPDIVLLTAGMNDALPTGANSSAAQFAADYTLLLAALQQRLPAAKVLVSSIVLSRFSASTEANIAAYNALLPGLAASANGTFVDMAAATDLCGAAAFGACCDDSTHPTSGGYAAMAAVWWRFIAFFFPESAARAPAPIPAPAPPLSLVPMPQVAALAPSGGTTTLSNSSTIFFTPAAAEPAALALAADLLSVFGLGVATKLSASADTLPGAGNVLLSIGDVPLPPPPPPLPPPAPAAACNASAFLPATNFNNSDFADPDGPRTTADAAGCCALCASTDGCEYWSFLVDASVPGEQCRWATLTFCCFMHSTNADPVADSRWTSGARPPQPALPPTGAVPPTTMEGFEDASYSLTARAEAGVSAVGASVSALHHAGVTILQAMLPPPAASAVAAQAVRAAVAAASPSLPDLDVVDWPLRPWRGLQIDLSSGYYHDMQLLYRAVDLCRMVKASVIVLHTGAETWMGLAMQSVEDMNVSWRHANPAGGCYGGCLCESHRQQKPLPVRTLIPSAVAPIANLPTQFTPAPRCASSWHTASHAEFALCRTARPLRASPTTSRL